MARPRWIRGRLHATITDIQAPRETRSGRAIVVPVEYILILNDGKLARLKEYVATTTMAAAYLIHDCRDLLIGSSHLVRVGLVRNKGQEWAVIERIQGSKAN